MFLKDNEIWTRAGCAGEKKKEKREKVSKKPEAQMRGNRQNMQSGINGYSRRLIEGLGSFGRLAEFLVQFLTNNNNTMLG